MSRSGGLKERAVAGKPKTIIFKIFLKKIKKVRQQFLIITVSNQVDPQKLNGNKGLWDTESCGKEDADNFANVGRDQISNKLNKT